MSDTDLPIIVQGSERALSNGTCLTNGLIGIKHEVIDLDEEGEGSFIVTSEPEVKASPAASTSPSHVVSECNCSVEELLREPYAARDFSRTLEIIRQGRPKPCVKSTCNRLLKEQYYDRVDWLTGCTFLGKLFCWPCLIFDKVDGLWNRTGFDDVSNFFKSHKRHENTQNHIVASMQLVAFVLNHFERARSFDEDLSGVIRSNRESMARIVETVCAAGLGSSKGLATRHLLRLARRETCILATIPTLHIDTAKAVTQSYSQAVSKDLLYSPFVSLILDEFEGRLAAVFRYSNYKGELCHSFMGFFDDTNLSQVVDKLQTEFSLKGKLVALLLGATSRIETVPDDPKIIVFHSPAHRMSHVLPYAFHHIKECASFFHVIRCFETWLSDSQVEAVIKAKLPSSNLIKWKERPVTALHEQKELIQDLVLSVLDKPTSWQHSSYTASLALQQALKDMEFTFLLRVFKELLPVTDALLDMILTNSPNMKLCAETVEDYLKVLNWKKEKFFEIWEYIQEVDLDGPTAKRPRHGGASKLLNYYRTLYETIVDSVVSHVKMRFGSILVLEFAELIDMKMDDQLAVCEKHVVMLKSKRDNFELGRLRNELIVAYAQVDFKGLSCDQLLKHLFETGLGEPLKQLTLLARLILMYPYTTKSSLESCSRLFSSIRSFATKMSSDPSLKIWSCLSVEYGRINKLALSSSFLLSTVDIFATEHPSIQLVQLDSRHDNNC